jgi:hypothetical protein
VNVTYTQQQKGQGRTVMLYKPGSRKAAQAFKGTKLGHYWSEDRGFPPAFYGAEVVEVPQVPTENDPVGIYFTLHCKHLIAIPPA